MQQENEHAPEFQGVDTRSWTSFFRLAERWESAHSLDRIDMLYELLQGYLRGELWPTILPNVYGGTALTASPARPYWMKSARRWPIETFTRLDFLRAAKGFAGLHLHFQSESIKVDDATGRVVSRNYADDPFAAGHRGLIGISLDKYADSFIESYIKKLTPSPNAVVRWCSNHNWPVPSGLSCSETGVSAADQEEHANESMKETETTGKIRRGDAWPDQQRKKATKPRGGGGRKKGSGSFAGKDKPLLELMKPLIADGKAHWAAAMEVVDKAAGAGTDESKAKRLVKRFKEWEKTTQFN